MDNFTPEQEQLIDAYHDEWLRLGYSQEPINQNRMEKTLGKLYALEGLKNPQLIIVSGPTAIVKEAKSAGDNRKPREVWNEVFEGPWGMYGLKFYKFGEEIDPKMYDDKDSAELQIWLDLCLDLHCGLFYENVVFACERPTVLQVDANGSLHCENGPSLAYADDTIFYDWHGVEVPESVIMRPESISIKQIDDEPNQEVKRVMLERFTVARYLLEGKAEIVDTDKDNLGQPRTLYRKQIPGTEVTLFMLHVKNSTPEPDGSSKDYFLEVHPECRPMSRDDQGRIQLGEPQKLTCANAVASTFGLRGEEYAPLVES